MKTEDTSFWAIVELLGRQQLAGKLSEFIFGGCNFIRVTVPETQNQPAFDRLLSSSAIYAINPVTEEVARFKAEQLVAKPIEVWDLKTMMKKHLELQQADGETNISEQELERKWHQSGSEDKDDDYFTNPF